MIRKGLKIILVVLFTWPFLANSQVTVDVKMDTNMLLIGDQTKFTLEANYPDSVFVRFPVFSDTIIDKLEIVDIAVPDTLHENNFFTVKHAYTVTSFDSGWYTIPPQPFTIGFPASDKVDTLHSLETYFGVITMPLDTANPNAIADIKAPVSAPVTFKEILPFAGGFIGLLLLAFVVYYLYKRLAKKEPVFVKKEKPKEPAHVIALRDLEQLTHEKLWQKGEVKQYYSELTEIVRRYIEDRFNKAALEQTTDEIIDEMRTVNEVDKVLKDGLFDLLVRADLVKFAKGQAVADENEQSLQFAYNFVNKTKPVVQLRDENSEPGKGDNTNVENSAN